MSAIIQGRNLTKRYQTLTAVNGISFEIQRGECFGMLGPNGAGKTSTIRMITCTSPVSGGELWVDGKDVRRDARAIKAVLGVVSQADSLDPDLTVIQNLLSYGRFFNLPSAVARQRAAEALELFQLKEKLSQKPDVLSGGMRRRLLIARALLNNPRVLVLDEPTTGLDPQSRLLVWDKLSYLKSQGITIVLTTHYMEEAAYLCDRLVVMDNGSILVEGTPSRLVEEHVGYLVTELRVSQQDKVQVIQALRGRGLDPEDRGDSIVVYGQDGAGDLERLDGSDYKYTRRPGNLEDLFLKLTGRGLREE